MVKFLSDEWFDLVAKMTAEAGDLQIPKAMADVAVNLTVRTPQGDVEMVIDGGLIKKGFKKGADVDMSMPDDYAYKLLVGNDWGVGMRGYIKRKIQLTGNLKKLIPLQSYTPSQPTVEMCEKLALETEFAGEVAAAVKGGAAGDVKDVNPIIKKASKAKKWVAKKLDNESRLMQPLKINNLTLKNRIIMPPMTPVWANPDETPSQREIDYWVERAEGGVGLIITEVNSVDSAHRYQPLSVGLHSDYQIEQHKKLVDAVHAAGAKIFPQISHPGPESLAPFFDKDENGNPVEAIGPSVNRGESTGQVCRELRDDEMPALIAMYGDAALRAKKAGYDGIELHMAHNYMLLGSFLSPLKNKREEGRYEGFTVEGRLQLTLDVLADIRAKVGDDYPLIVRISGDENVAGACGRDMTDTQLIAPILVEHGVDAFHVSGGVINQLVTNIIAGANFEPGFNVPPANAIKEVVDVPVLAVGCIHDPEYAEQILRDGKADAIVMGRPLIADPELPKKVKEGRTEDVRKCVRCLTCVDSLMKLEDLHCAVNGRMGKEKEMPLNQKAAKSKRVMVVGSGPGGMEAARVAAERGHQVSLFDKHLRLGGSLVTACTVHPDNETLLDYMMTQIKKLPIDVNLGVEVTPELVRKINPDVLIDASGGEVVAPKIPGDNLRHVLTGTMMHKMMYGDLPPYGVEKLPLYVKAGVSLGGDIMQKIMTPKLIAGATKLFMPMVGKNVVVVGMDLAAIETAEFLAERGHKVAVFDTYEELAPEIGVKRTHEHTERLRNLGVTLHTETEVTKITPNEVIYKPKYAKKEYALEADTVILAGEIEPQTDLYDACKEFVAEAYMVGDVSGLGLIDKAIQEANEVVYGLG